MYYFVSIAAIIFSPYSSLPRNPRASSDGNVLQLSNFLAVADNASSVSGVLISIELQNAAYRAEMGLGVFIAVADALSKSGYSSQTSKKIMIKSSDSVVLSMFSDSDYELVYAVDEDVRDILNSTIMEIKKFASSVVVSKESLFPTHASFLIGETAIVPKLHSHNISVYVQLFRNEFRSQPLDFFSDHYVEINAHSVHMGVDGVIKDILLQRLNSGGTDA